MSDVPTLPTYDKPKERQAASLPEGLPAPPPKPPSSLNKLMGKMLKPNLKRAMKLPTNKRKHKVKFY